MPPPLQLPGFYWDEDKNRYFPLSSRPAVPVSSTSRVEVKPETEHDTQNHHPPPDPWYSFQALRSSQDVMLRHRKAKEILSSHYARTSRCKHSWIPTSGRIRAFNTTSFNGSQRRFIGDDQGWLYACMSPEVEEQDMITDVWLPDLSLHPGSEITSICISGSKCIATCLGPSARISVQDLNVVGRISLITVKNVHDIWAAHLEGNSLAIGADKRAVYLHDFDTTTQLKYLETQSDVFAIYQRDNMVYTGSRNGSITRFDLRLKTYGQKLFDHRFTGRARSPVLHLGIVNEYQLLTSQMDGELALYDLRFPRLVEPLVSFRGHVNTHRRRLGIAVDPNEQFLFAAGEDCRIRGWSLNMGIPIEPPPIPDNEEKVASITSEPDELERRMNNPFRAVFPNPVTAMQVTIERKGVCLWAVNDEDLYRYHLGQQDDWIT
ncbi:WD40-repeat-containing domain protein [Amanita muscaria]